MQISRGPEELLDLFMSFFLNKILSYTLEINTDPRREVGSLGFLKVSNFPGKFHFSSARCLESPLYQEIKIQEF